MDVDSSIRRKTKQIQVGSVKIGGDAPIVVQSMTNTDTRDIGATVAQIRALQQAGCGIVRVLCLTKKLSALPSIKSRSRSGYRRYSFSLRLAIGAIKKVRRIRIILAISRATKSRK